jgi:D-amino-acid oxidase
VQSYEEVPKESLAPGIEHGDKYTSIMINVPMYLSYLLEKARSLGATDIRASLPHNSNLSETLKAAQEVLHSHLQNLGQENVPEIQAFINATGISALTLVPDPSVYPIRGQTVTVAGEANQITTIAAYPPNPTPNSTPIMYILPRPHSKTTILGGTKQTNDWTATPDAQTTAEILSRAKEWAPELLNPDGEFEVLSVQVGFRPGREGGVRVEIEDVDDVVLCHAYGHAGAGYQNSVGSARKVVRLLGERLGR